MKIVNLKINGISNPIGFAYKKVKVSWQVESFTDKKQVNATIEVSDDYRFEKIIFSKSGNLDSVCEVLDIELKPRKRYFYRVKVAGDNGEQGISEIAFFETGKMYEEWDAEFIGTGDEDKFHPVFTKRFSISEGIKNAKIYITGLGLYEAYLNGKKIGEDFLAPFCNDYDEEIQYQTYDIKDLLSESNVIEIITGNGWYKGRFGLEGGKKEIYGNRFCTIAEMFFEYESGITENLITDDTWEYYGSDIEDSGIYDGEIYNRELYKNRNNQIKPVKILDMDKKKLVERYSCLSLIHI